MLLTSKARLLSPDILELTVQRPKTFRYIDIPGKESSLVLITFLLLSAKLNLLFSVVVPV